MTIFFKKIFLFMIPFVLVFLPPTAILFFAGEFYVPERVGELARGSRVVIAGSAYSNIRGDYQLQETLYRQPEIIALGTSRVGGFRSVFFKDPDIFYNDTGVGGALSNFRYFLEKISDHPPRIIIAGMDAYFFNPEEAKNNVVIRPDPFIERVPWYGPFFSSLLQGGGWWRIYLDYADGKFTLQNVFRRDSAAVTRIGLRAVADGNGFLNDGSNYFGDVIADSSSQEKIRQSIKRLSDSISESNGDEYGSDISEDALAEVRRFLDTSRKNNIHVIGFIPPMARAEYERLQSFHNASYAYAFNNLGKVLASVYKEYGFEFYDFTNIESFGGSDAEMVESKHGSEKLNLRLFITMAEKSKRLGSLVDTVYLTNKLMNAKSTYEVFPLTINTADL